jgi:hypothetical protein
MIIRMWSTSELRRVCTYHEGKECMEITRPLDPYAGGFRVMLDAAWKYNEPKNEMEAREVLKGCLNAAKMLNIPSRGQAPTSGDLARLAHFIADGLDELVKLPPMAEEKKVCGEGEVRYGDHRHSFELTEADVKVLKGEE